MAVRRKQYLPRWEFRAPSETCESVRDSANPCGRQAVAAYPAMGGGYFSMCVQHMQGHLDYSVTLDEARRGKTPHLKGAK